MIPEAIQTITADAVLPAATRTPGACVLEARDIVKVLGHGAGKVRALKGVSLALNAGELTLLMGPSGSGKTTLLSILGCIMTPTEGTLTIAGQQTRGLGPEELANLRRRNIGFIFQSYNLFPTLSAEENVRLALDVRGDRGSDAIVRAQRALLQVGLRHRLKSYPANLSGGEQQRVAVARALVGAPSVMLADEPTAALDSENGLAVMALLAELAKDKSRAVLAVTHDPRTVPFANRVLRIEDGLIVGEERRAEGVETVHELARTRKRKANA
jgi:putative ABC transport system ATP-binding protein